MLLSLVCLCASRPLLLRLPYLWGNAAAIGIVAGLALLANFVSRLVVPPGPWINQLILAAGGSAVLLLYLHLRRRAYSPALAEARLAALQARIRPHFLFNSINAVLSLIRRDPRRAEAALEDLADLIRVQLADTRRLVPLRDELALCRQYLTIEQMRLGDRLALRWEVDPAAEAALVPPLVLQPLLENAVYHGVEPNVTCGLIELTVRRDAARIQIAVRNPHLAVPTHQSGNRMAMQNIRERLALAFDVEAQLRTEMNETTYLVDVQLPFRTAAEPA